MFPANFNPSQMMSQMFGNNTSNMNPMAEMMRKVGAQNGGQLPGIDRAKFSEMAKGWSQEDLQRLAMEGKSQGMSEQQIADGLNFILNLK